MLIRGATREDLTAAVRATPGVRFFYEPYAVGRGWRFRLKTDGPKPRFGRVSANQVRRNGERRRIPGAVCWHGHREFMRALFERAPGATLETGLITYRGREDFERRHASTGLRNVGSQVWPVFYGNCCDCDDTQ